jgi:hypothetical protein
MTTGHRACFNCKFGLMVFGKRYGTVIYVHFDPKSPKGVYLITEADKELFSRFGCHEFQLREE